MRILPFPPGVWLLSLGSHRLVSCLQRYALATNFCLNTSDESKRHDSGKPLYEIVPTHPPTPCCFPVNPYREADGITESPRRRVGINSLDPSPPLSPYP